MQTKIIITLGLALLLFSCNKYEPDQIRTQPSVESKTVPVGKAGYGLIDLKKLVQGTTSIVVTIENQDAFGDRLQLLDNGYLAYRAPNEEVTETVRLKIADEFSDEPAQTEVQFQVQTLPAGTNTCFTTLQLDLLRDQPITIDPFRDDTLCGYTPRRSAFRVLYGFDANDYTVNADGTIQVQPNPGGRGLDFLVYYGEYEQIDSSYIGLIALTNQLGCVPYGQDDRFTIQYHPDSTFYTLDVLANDIFCEWDRLDGQVTFTTGNTTHGTLEIINGQKVIYRLNNPPTSRLTEQFQYAARFKNGPGASFAEHCCFFVQMSILP